MLLAPSRVGETLLPALAKSIDFGGTQGWLNLYDELCHSTVLVNYSRFRWADFDDALLK
jgi:hypothetical protein